MNIWPFWPPPSRIAEERRRMEFRRLERELDLEPWPFGWTAADDWPRLGETTGPNPFLDVVKEVYGGITDKPGQVYEMPSIREAYDAYYVVQQHGPDPGKPQRV